MLPEPKLKLLLDLVKSSTKEELVWMNGYLYGLMTATQLDAPHATALAPAQESAEPARPAVQKITIAYGTETGNSKKLAADFAAKAKKSGINAKLVSLDQYRMTDLSKEEYFFTIISTQGEGEPPAGAKKFYDQIHQNGFKLNQMKYGVLALGDTSYPLFCKAGEDVDAQFQKLGGERIVSLQKCDTDYEADANGWFSQVLQTLSTNGNGKTAAAPAVVAKKSTGKKVYTGTVITNVNLNDIGSAKKTHHIELMADDVEYLPGDSIGVVAENAQANVDAIIALTGVNGNKSLSYRNEQHTIYELLKKKLNIAWLPERVVKLYAGIVKQDIPATKIGLYDLLKIYPVSHAAQFEEVIGILEPITPRLYSISSSPEAHSGEVHITVAREQFRINDEIKCGFCSDYLLQLQENNTLEFYIHKNNLFRLPAPEKDVIMIGPGTGIAPFRSFLAERDATGATGRNWLFFGEQHFLTDFLYQTEVQNWVQTGVLSRANVAFSRDQQYKLYVQHRLLQEAMDVWQWINGGAYIYVCGAKEPMSTDVEYTLLQIIERFGNKSSSQAIEFLLQLQEEGRYLKDVY
jgi:sulfite reductase (NADPH) flavoprotein alpha-component